MQRKPSHFGSYCQLSSAGISSTDFVSIGGNGGLIVNAILNRRVSRVAAWFEFRRARAMQHRALDGNVSEFLSIGRGTKQQSSATHIATPDEIGRETQTLAEMRE